jgi:hypothetical protein
MGAIAYMPYEDYLKQRNTINDEYLRGLMTTSEWRERRIMLECQYWLGI